jgi:hypothetical protein
MTIMAIVSGFDYFRKYLPALLAREADQKRDAASAPGGPAA